MINEAKIKAYYEFLQFQRDTLVNYNMLRVKASLQMRAMVIKVIKYPYFVLELDHVMLINTNNPYYNKFPTMNNMINKTI